MPTKKKSPVTVNSKKFGLDLFKPFYITDDVKIFCMEVPKIGVYLLSNGQLTFAPGTRIKETKETVKNGKVIGRELVYSR